MNPWPFAQFPIRWVLWAENPQSLAGSWPTRPIDSGIVQIPNGQGFLLYCQRSICCTFPTLDGHIEVLFWTRIPVWPNCDLSSIPSISQPQGYRLQTFILLHLSVSKCFCSVFRRECSTWMGRITSWNQWLLRVKEGGRNAPYRASIWAIWPPWPTWPTSRMSLMNSMTTHVRSSSIVQIENPNSNLKIVYLSPFSYGTMFSIWM